ncbi:unnamed protein product [Victoria cruziana]
MKRKEEIGRGTTAATLDARFRKSHQL